MESELSSLPQSMRRQLHQNIVKYRKQFDDLKNFPPKTQKNEDNSNKIGNVGQEVMNNGQIINDIEKIASETEQLASNVNQTMSSGTRALQNAKSQDIKTHLRKADLAINMLNRKVVVDKASLYVIIILLAIIDLLALYIKIK